MSNWRIRKASQKYNDTTFTLEKRAFGFLWWHIIGIYISLEDAQFAYKAHIAPISTVVVPLNPTGK